MRDLPAITFKTLYEGIFEFVSGSAISDVEAQEHYDRFFEVCFV